MITTTDIALMTLFTLIFVIWLVTMIYMRLFMPRPPPLQTNSVPCSSGLDRGSPIIFENIELQLRTPPPTISPDIIRARPPPQARELPLPDPYLAQTSTFD
jgi:hypothetical protein